MKRVRVEEGRGEEEEEEEGMERSNVDCLMLCLFRFETRRGSSSLSRKEGDVFSLFSLSDISLIKKIVEEEKESSGRFRKGEDIGSKVTEKMREGEFVFKFER